jgi:hypothetical protein
MFTQKGEGFELMTSTSWDIVDPQLFELFLGE